MTKRADLDAVFAVHDDLIARRGVDVWVGAEPTFTRHGATGPAWTTAVEGDDKLARALALAAALADRLPGAAVTRVVGRADPDEPAARFAFGVRWRDDAPLTARGDRATLDDVPVAAPGVDELGADRWLTIAPDLGVLEVNTAPCATSASFAAHARDVWTAARAAGLSATRYRENGDVADSGGGGQITLGGATPDASPFVRYPHVLPALVRYLNNHPALSYWFASERVGSASQGPRPDEGVRERYEELELTLERLEQRADHHRVRPDALWAALAPLLVDASGNARRAELNVEKLWSPHLTPHGARHGKMGVVELRAIRMPEQPEMLAALAALLRGLVARLAIADYRAPLVDWHDELHDRYALPAALAHDLRRVLGDLDDHGFGLPLALRRELEAWRPPGLACKLGDATLVVRPALEFWPLVGDVASQERAGARAVDASTQRYELSIAGPGPDRIVVAGRWVQLRDVGEGVRALGVRRRVYEPQPGFHPGLPILDPLVIEWSHAGRVQTIEIHAWRPGGGAYDGLPLTADEALLRRNERIRILTRAGEAAAPATWSATSPFTLDLRRAR